MQSVLKNKYVLYAVSALAVLNVLGYLSIGSMECLGVFALTALVCQQYQKNMTICLLAAIFAANVVFGCGRIKENFTEGALGGGKSEEPTNSEISAVAGEGENNGDLPTGSKEVVDACIGKAQEECNESCSWKNGKCATSSQ